MNYKKLLEAIKYIKWIRYIEKHGVAPSEGPLKIDLDSPEVKTELERLDIKNVSLSFLARVRKELKGRNINSIRRKKP